MVEQPIRPLPAEPDFEVLGRRLSAVLAEIMHRPERTWTTDSDLYAQALRRLLEHGGGFITYREHVDLLNGHTIIDRMNREDAEKVTAEARREVHRIVAEAAKELAASLRFYAMSVPSRYRREGVELAADALERLSGWHRTRMAPHGLEAI